ncbi:DUF1638 domain-containing protein [Spirochaeta isovalerica]|uniref:DUF1638 domain-containing protein n=1 Tax=Spirochaeta isovalerica TaxID=150 RepID=A0A841RB88_9SPIO|nr:DUF1638 domain-containing protein [Spirochaeta isovalerica]MBB6480179.1 hypothetical protein [Spirochaeta isovalerica]
MEIVSCGILKKEIQHLVRKNRWTFRERYLDSSLHIDFNKLENALDATLTKVEASPPLLVYGTCHPLMDEICRRYGAVRTEGQNCVEILLGKDIFQRELKRGAFFLLEDWARSWDRIIPATMGSKKSIQKEIFRDSHKYFLALRTPCSDDFKNEAEQISREMGLPLHWRDADLKNLENVLKKTMSSFGSMQP